MLGYIEKVGICIDKIDFLNQLKTKGVKVEGKDLVLHVDRAPCKTCGQNGGIKSM